MGGVALHRLDQIGHQILPLLELHIDVGEGALPRLAQTHQPVEQEYREQDDNGDDNQGNDHGRAESLNSGLTEYRVLPSAPL